GVQVGGQVTVALVQLRLGGDGEAAEPEAAGELAAQLTQLTAGEGAPASPGAFRGVADSRGDHLEASPPDDLGSALAVCVEEPDQLLHTIPQTLACPQARRTSHAAPE